MSDLPRPKVWEYERLLTEHAFDKLRLIDCGFAEFAASLEHAVVIEEVELSVDNLKELVLTLEWTRPLHVVVVVDSRRREERIVTVYEPAPDRWTDGYSRRR